jgi:hypothetical protein
MRQLQHQQRLLHQQVTWFKTINNFKILHSLSQALFVAQNALVKASFKDMLMLFSSRLFYQIIFLL